jgi:hypothetical protein
MSTTINGTVASSTVVEPKSFWAACKGIAVDLTKEAGTFVSKMSTEVVGPAIGKTTVIALDCADKGLKSIIVNGNKAIEGRPYIAMALSPSTILRMAAIKAYEQEFGGKTSKTNDATNAAVTTQQ